LKGIVYKNSPHAEDVLKEIIRWAVSAVSEHEHQTVFNNLFTKCQRCLRAEGCFQHLLLIQRKLYNTDSEYRFSEQVTL
jgi:hypothetical protein